MSSSSNNSNKLSSVASKMGSFSHDTGSTSTMRDRQARNKDPATGVSYDFLDEAGRAAPSGTLKKPSRIAYAEDAYESLERRRWAATILDSPELLLMHSLSRGDSLTGTKHHFTKILCGYDDPPKPAEKILPKKEAEISFKAKVYKPFTGAFEM